MKRKDQEKGKAIENESENNWLGLLSLLGVVSSLLASLNQVLRLWNSTREEHAAEDARSLSAELDAVERELKAIREALEQLKSEKDC